MKTALSALALLLSTSCGAPTKTESTPKAAASCGDKKVDPPEQCDDGNNTDGDGCDKACQRETKPATAPATIATSQPAEPPPSTGKSVAYDGRRELLTAPVLNGIIDAPKLPIELEKKILGGIAASYHSKPEECKGEDDTLLGVRYSATGSFTAAGKSETAYVITRLPCDPAMSLFDLGDSMYLEIFEGDTRVASFKGKTMLSGGETNEFTGEKINGIIDVNQDGISELVISTSGFGQGTEIVIARVYSVEDKKITLLKEADDVYNNSCAGGMTPQVEAAVLSYQMVKKGEPVSFTSEAYLAPCQEKYELTDFTRAPTE